MFIVKVINVHSAEIIHIEKSNHIPNSTNININNIEYHVIKKNCRSDDGKSCIRHVDVLVCPQK